MRIGIVVFIFFILAGAVWPVEMVSVDRWSFDELIHRNLRGAVVKAEDELVVMFSEQGVYKIHPDSLELFARKGRGPDEILHWTSICKKEDKVAIVELHGKIQVFQKQGDGYTWAENVWREEKGCQQIVHSSLFVDDCWILGGTVGVYGPDEDKNRDSLLNPCMLRLLKSDGTFVKSLVHKKYPRLVRHYLFDSFLLYDQEYIYFILESALEVFRIHRQSMKLEKVIPLPKPVSYLPMPETVYLFKDRMNAPGPGGFWKKSSQWKSSYSAVTGAVLTQDHLVIQIRTPVKGRKTFALLFYDPGSFQLVDTLQTDDLLVTRHKDRVYFLAGGDPLVDEPETFEIVVNRFK